MATEEAAEEQIHALSEQEVALASEEQARKMLLDTAEHLQAKSRQVSALARWCQPLLCN